MKAAVSQAQSVLTRVGVIGLGLIGGSFALDLRRRGLASEVIGHDLSPVTRQAALDQGLVQAVTATAAELVERVELILLAVPVSAVEPLLVEVRSGCQRLAPGVEWPVVTDVASVKGEVCAAARRVFQGVPARFVPGHPIAGSERHGVGAAQADLFAGHKVVLTPDPTTPAAALQQVTSLWRGLGADVVCMEAARHDLLLAGSSHLPHLLAFALVDTLASRPDSDEIFDFAAGGFRDFTRIAGSDPLMWRDIFRSNGPAVLEQMDAYLACLQRLRQAIAEGDGDLLAGTFDHARAARRRYLNRHADRSAPESTDV